MSATVLYISISLDGFVAGPNEGLGKGSARPLGVGYQGTPEPPHPRAILTRLSPVPHSPVPRRPIRLPRETTPLALSQLAWTHLKAVEAIPPPRGPYMSKKTTPRNALEMVVV